ncbi:MAG: hypothetical protein MRY83_22665 [Flavobacteriales bacterium]|nr:hypothetical protein [Flavobacteriales bacterium]
MLHSIQGFEPEGEPELHFHPEENMVRIIFCFMPPLRCEDSEYSKLFPEAFRQQMAKAVKKKVIQDDRETFLIKEANNDDINGIRLFLENFWNEYADIELTRLYLAEYDWSNACRKLKEMGEIPKTLHKACFDKLDGSYIMLKTIPELMTEVKSLTINPTETISKLPEGISDCHNLSKLNIHDAVGIDLEQVVDQIKGLPKLKELNIWNSQTTLPDNLLELASLTKLTTHGNQLTEINPSILEMPKLKQFTIWKETNLKYSKVTSLRKKAKFEVYYYNS